MSLAFFGMHQACGTSGGLDTYRGLVGKKPNGNKLLGRPSHRWKDNIKMDVKRGGWEEMEWMMWLRVGTVGKLP